MKKILYILTSFLLFVNYCFSQGGSTTPTLKQVVNSGNVAYKPVFYNANYSYLATTRWLTDKNYVDSLFATGAGGTGTVKSFTVTAANGVSGIVTSPTINPAVTLSVTVVSGNLFTQGTATITATGNTSISGINTGDQTTISGNAGSATSVNVVDDNSGSGPYYMSWYTGTGNQIPKISSSKLLWSPNAGTFFVNGTAQITASTITPLIIGGSGTTQSLIYRTTTGVGTVGADHIFQTGTGGATEAMRILNSGFVGIGTNTPTATLHVSGMQKIISGPLTDQITALTITGTLPSGSVSTFNTLINATATTNNSTSNAYAFNMTMAAGATDGNAYAAGRFSNSVAGTGSNFFSLLGNSGLFGISTATTIGNNAGLVTYASGGNTSYGVFSQAVVDKNSGVDIGVAGFALNNGTSSAHIGGYFGLQNSTPTYVSAALMCDNGSTSSSIFMARANGISKVVVDNIGTLFSNIKTQTPILVLPGSSSGTVTVLPAAVITTYSWTFPPNAGTNGFFLKTDGTGASTWAATPAATYTATNVGNNLTITNGTYSANPTLNLVSTPTFVATNVTGLPLNTGVTGLLPLANGGTNANLTSINGGVVYSTASSFSITSAGTSGQFLMSNGTSAPTYTTILTLPAGTSGQTLRYGSSWTANSLLYNDGSNIGINNTSPIAKLDVSQTGTVTALNISTIGNYTTTTTTTGLISNAEGSILATGAQFSAKAVNGGTANALLALSTDTNTIGYNNAFLASATKAKYNTAGTISSIGGTTAIGLDVTASGASSGNYAALFRAGLVGIGTALPTQPLQIQGSSGIGTQLYINTTSGSPGVVLGNNTSMASATQQVMFGMAASSSDFFANTSSGDAIVDSKAGKLFFGFGASSSTGGTAHGIWTTTGLSIGDDFYSLPTPTAKLHVTSTSTTSSTFVLKTDDASNNPLFYARSDGAFGFRVALPASTVHIVGSGNDVNTSSFRVDNSSSTNLMLIKNNGQIGIGTTGQSAMLHVVSTGSTSATYALKVYSNGGSLPGWVVVDDGGLSTSTGINTSAGDAATINAPSGRFRKDNSGSVFTLTNSLIGTNSLIILTPVTAGLTGGKYLTVQAGTGSATITFEDISTGVATAPSGSMDVNFWIVNR